MNLDVVILRLKALCPLFNGNVAGAAEYQLGVKDEAWLPPPAAYVIPLDDEAGDNLDLQGVDQFVTERIGVIVMFSNAVGVAAGDRRGQTASELFNPIKWQLYGAMLNWRPNSSVENLGFVLPTDPGADHSAKGFAYAGGRLLDANLALLWYEWDFSLVVQITDADGSWPPITANLQDLWIGIIKLFYAGHSFTGQPLEQLLAATDISLPPDDRSPVPRQVTLTTVPVPLVAAAPPPYPASLVLVGGYTFFVDIDGGLKIRAPDGSIIPLVLEK